LEPDVGGTGKEGARISTLALSRRSAWRELGLGALVGGMIGLVAAVEASAVRWAVVLTLLYWVLGIYYTRVVLGSRFLLTLFIGAYGIRIMLAFLLYVTHPPDGFYFKDSLYYLRVGMEILEQWRSGHPVFDLDMYQLAASSRNWGYSVYNALHYILAPGHLLPSISNAFVGSLLGVVVYRLAREIFSVRVARISAILTAFHSGLIWYSAVNLKDALVALMIALIMIYGVRAVRYSFRKDLLKMIIAATFLFTLRFYMAPFTLAFVALYWFAHSRVRLRRKVALAVALIACAVLLASILPGVERTLNQIRRAGGVPEFIISYAERGFEKVQGKETTILGQLEKFSLRSAVITGMRFVLNPNPLNLHDVTWLLLPGILVWYAMVPFFITGGLSLLRKRPVTAVLLFGFVVGGILLYSLLPNLTEMRHRFQFTAIAMIVATWGVMHLQTWHRIFAAVFWTLLVIVLTGSTLGVLSI